MIRVIAMVGLWLLFVATVVVILIASDIRHIEQSVDSRRYLDCVMSPAGDELLCKQVTVTDPPYKP